MKVSVLVATYNQESVIEDCLRGILIQQLPPGTELEIIIHDDASTDRTLERVDSFRRSHECDLTVIAQRENKLSKGEGILATYLFPKSTGDLIAICDGDDFWIHPLKLTRQISLFEQDRSVVCVHTSLKRIDDQGGGPRF